MIRQFISRLVFLFLVMVSIAAEASITLPKIFTDNMVLQRDRPVRVWGSANKGETVTVSFNGNKVITKATNNGQWSLLFPAMSYGGPFEMTVAAKSGTIIYKNVLIGDVWVCSGQSNMEMMVKEINSTGKEMATGNYPNIRLFTVKHATAFTPQNDLAGGEWQECNQQTAANFSAVAYFFGKQLNKDINVPVGLICTSWGGTIIQTWTSWDVMGKEDEYKNLNLTTMEEKLKAAEESRQKFMETMQYDKGAIEKWYEPGTSIADWRPINVSQNWESTAIGNVDGIIWFRKDIEIDSMDDQPVTLSLGPIDDIDATYVNGKLVGTTNGWQTERKYTINTSLLKKGKNTIVVKVRDDGGGGGIYGNAQLLYLQTGNKKISLADGWIYKTSVVSRSTDNITGPNAFPSQLYNAMIAPLTQYAIKGCTWYQGESNAFEAYKYRQLFPAMINDWRKKWGYEFPFYWVQLANFRQPNKNPSASEWAELREAQSNTLSLPQTGQAVIIDIGDANDIHPKNKYDAGYRLALAAEKITYTKDIIHSGPVFQSQKTEGNKMVLGFTNTGSGLMAKDKYGYLKGFAISGSNQQFVWAKALIEGNKIIVYSDTVANPVAVRYAWADNPDEANLYNKEGLPASPFRTDNWKGITEK